MEVSAGEVMVAWKPWGLEEESQFLVKNKKEKYLTESRNSFHGAKEGSLTGRWGGPSL